MKNSRQIIRWALPGFISLALFILLILTGPDTNLQQIIGFIQGTDTSDSINIVGGIAGALAIVTALGYLYSVTHHLLLNTIYPEWMNSDLRSAIRSCGLKVFDYDGKEINPNHLSVTGAWIAVNAAWHSSKGPPDSEIAGAEWRSQSMYDIMHGAGATFIGIVTASFTGVAAGGISMPQTMLFAGAILISAFNLAETAKRAQAITGSLMMSLFPRARVDAVWVDRKYSCLRPYRGKS